MCTWKQCIFCCHGLQWSSHVWLSLLYKATLEARVCGDPGVQACELLSGVGKGFKCRCKKNLSGRAAWSFLSCDLQITWLFNAAIPPHGKGGGNANKHELSETIINSKWLFCDHSDFCFDSLRCLRLLALPKWTLYMGGHKSHGRDADPSVKERISPTLWTPWTSQYMTLNKADTGHLAIMAHTTSSKIFTHAQCF